MQIHKYIHFPKNYRKIDPKVAGGSYILSPFKMYKMSKNGFTDILDLRNESKIKKYIEKFECKLFNINYVNIKVSFNSEEMPSLEFYKNINNILKKNKKTYVHCKRGEHRTGLSLAAYEKISTSHNDKEIIEKLNNFWGPRNKLTRFYDNFLSQFKIKT